MTLFDLRTASRRLLRVPAFSAVAVLLLGLSFGAFACVFSIVYGLLCKPLPYPGGERLVSVETHMLGFPFNAGLSAPLLADMARNTRTLDGIAGYRKDRLAVRDENGRSETTFDVARVEPALFGLLGAQPAIGRLLADDDTVQGAATLAAIGVVACWLPALRASRVDPVVALRDE